MNKIIMVVITAVSLSACSDPKETTAEVSRSAIKFSKEVLGGIKDGVDEGRKEAEGADGAVVVTNIDELEKDVDVNVLLVKSIDNDKKTDIEVGFMNSGDKPVRIANLDDRGTVLLLDVDGYSQELDSASRHSAEITVPANAGVKHHLVFNVPVSKAKTLRLWNKEYEIKNIPIIKESDSDKSADTI